MKFTIALMLSLLFGATAYAGSGYSTMSCVSDSGRTNFRSSFGDLSGVIDSATFTIDGVSIHIDANDRLPINQAILVNLDFKVFTYSVEVIGGRQGYAFIQLIANPRTLVVSESPSFMAISFRGQIVGTEPRPNLSLRSKIIEVQCQISYDKP